jgi:hypothetical protein
MTWRWSSRPARAADFTNCDYLRCSPVPPSCPGKGNPVIPEVVNQICFQIICAGGPFPFSDPRRSWLTAHFGIYCFNSQLYAKLGGPPISAVRPRLAWFRSERAWHPHRPNYG